MAEYAYPLLQTVEDDQNFIFDNSIACGRGIIIHNSGSGIFTVRPIVTNPCATVARFLVLFHSNVAIPEGGTAGPISVALSINGEPDQTTVATTTPTVPEAFFNVGFASYLTIPVGCCTQIAVENISNADIVANKSKLIIVPAS